MVTPTYYVYFTTTTIISSIVLFRGFNGTPVQIITMVNGFLTICAGVVLLQLSKSAKDVPDAAVFKGDLDQIQTIAEQREPETEPKADAIRGTAAILRRVSQARQRWEAEEFQRLREDKLREQLEPVGEDGPTYEWDGLRRRRTISVRTGTHSPAMSSAFPPPPFPEPPRTPRKPLGMSEYPTQEELAQWERERDSIRTPSILSSIAGTIRARGRSFHTPLQAGHKPGSPMQPMPLTEISFPSQSYGEGGSYHDPASQTTDYRGAGGLLSVPGGSVESETPRRQFSFHNFFRRQSSPPPPDLEQPSPEPAHDYPRAARRRGYSNLHAKAATEEERIGLVKSDTNNTNNTTQEFPLLQEKEYVDNEKAGPKVVVAPTVVDTSRYGRGITTSPQRSSDEQQEDAADGGTRGRRRDRGGSSGQGSGTHPLPPLPPVRERPPPGDKDGAFI